jgi:hypothetical protein
MQPAFLGTIGDPGQSLKNHQFNHYREAGYYASCTNWGKWEIRISSLMHHHPRVWEIPLRDGLADERLACN